jgi:hypothetical protein
MRSTTYAWPSAAADPGAVQSPSAAAARRLGRIFRHLAHLLAAQHCAYEALDSAGVPTRDAKRRGAGWLPGLADIGWSNRLGWYEGFHLLLAVNPVGVITGFGFGAASTKDQPLVDTFFALRRCKQRYDVRCVPSLDLAPGLSWSPT